jgi:uroporphyrinogen-III synthase
LRVFSLDEHRVLKAATADVITRPPDYLVASTGFGMRTWLAAAASWDMDDALLTALRRTRVANRGAKAALANAAVGLAEWYRAPHERLDELVERVLVEPVAGRRVVLQLHGVADPGVGASLVAAGAAVVEVDACRLSLPV